MRIFFPTALILSMAFGNTNAAEIGVKFSGSVMGISASPYGLSIASNESVSGRFIYDTNAPLTHVSSCSGDCAHYRQQIVNGVSVTIGNVAIRSDDFVVVISNDVTGVIFQPKEDVFSVLFQNNLTPPLTSPLVVDGIPRSKGYLNISLSGPPGVFTDSSLPQNLNYSMLPARVGVFGDGEPTDRDADIFFSVNNVSTFDVVPGDYNFDESVDHRDYLHWLATYGSMADLSADGNRNRIVDAADYVLWRKQLIQGPPVAETSVHAVPEMPTSRSLATAAVCIVLMNVINPACRFAR